MMAYLLALYADYQRHCNHNTPFGSNIIPGGVTFRVFAPAAIQMYVLTGASLSAAQVPGFVPSASDQLFSLVSIARSKPTAFEAVSFERLSPRMRGWPSTDIASTRCPGSGDCSRISSAGSHTHAGFEDVPAAVAGWRGG
jgi:hypothetical protein